MDTRAITESTAALAHKAGDLKQVKQNMLKVIHND